MGRGARLNHYRFCSTWRLAASPARVYAVLERAERYPRWWPQVRSLVPTGEDGGTARIRSVLPYVLTVTLRTARRDSASGILEIAMGGDLDGWARWTIRADGDGALALYEQEVDVRDRLLRFLALPAKPLLALNHAVMMRAGERRLRALLERGLDEE
ncbi:SRPBCC family protein [Streptomyces tubbatahanensis]|uniref:SRPBCC family protein n=1 Tax=Streptomyces tubbatahanensis TaxID=2923272 RepID=A0ABY3XNJ7_9ACTN|nr:SRPBCC family protein [Streptomyces tubbatahanensis]UNS95985.1 SRPBCC family protein [Streptomyces tubbatahanensis]